MKITVADALTGGMINGVSVFPRSERKTTWAINTKLGSHTMHGSGVARHALIARSECQRSRSRGYHVTSVGRCPWCWLCSPGVVSVVAVGMLVGVCVGVVALVAVLRCLHSSRRYVYLWWCMRYVSMDRIATRLGSLKRHLIGESYWARRGAVRGHPLHFLSPVDRSYIQPAQFWDLQTRHR